MVFICPCEMRSFRSNSKVRAGFILFEYSPTRNGENARNFLGAYSGYVVCDGYDGYNKLTEAIRCGCWAHARRERHPSVCCGT